MVEPGCLRLYEFPSTRSARCRWTLQELGVPFEAIEVDLASGRHRDPEFLQLNPYGRVPVLLDGDLVIFESAAICLYLGDRFPEKGLIPTAGTRDRALHDQWVFFCTNELEQPLWRIRRHTVLYPQEKRIPADIELAREDFRAATRVLQEVLAGKRYLVGDRFTIADIITAYTLYWATLYDLLKDFPILENYLEKQSERPTFPAELKR